MLLISSSIFPSSQVHVLFLPCSTGVLPEFFLSHLVFSRSYSFHTHPFNRSVVSFCSSSFRLIKPCISFQPECCPNLFFLVPCLSRFNQSGSNSFLSIVLVIHSFATSMVHMVFLVSIFYRSALNCVQLCCVLSFNFSTSQGSLVSLIGQGSNLVLPLLFLFLFPPVPF